MESRTIWNEFVFLDQSSINTGMTRLYGRSMLQITRRMFALSVPTIMSSVCANGDMVPLVFDGSLNGDIFKEYIDKCLAPTLKAGDIVIMDNLSSHKD